MSEKRTKYCSNCGAEIDARAKICPKCGVEQAPLAKEVVRHTAAWYLVPFFLGIIGGIIGYIVIKDDDKSMATNLLILGILMTFVIPIIIFLVAWAWIASLFWGLG